MLFNDTFSLPNINFIKQIDLKKDKFSLLYLFLIIFLEFYNLGKIQSIFFVIKKKGKFNVSLSLTRKYRCQAISSIKYKINKIVFILEIELVFFRNDIMSFKTKILIPFIGKN